MTVSSVKKFYWKCRQRAIRALRRTVLRPLRMYLIKKLNAVPMESQTTFSYNDRHEQMLYEITAKAKKLSEAHHPEYRTTTIDKYFLGSFAKRFLILWTEQLNSGKAK